MLFQIRVSQMLDVEYPILQGGMGFVGRAELAAAVFRADGFGIIASGHFATNAGHEARKE